MTTFSERMGFKRPKDTIQLESMDDDLRTGLWNALVDVYWNDCRGRDSVSDGPVRMKELIHRLWLKYFKLPMDHLDDTPWVTIWSSVKDKFFAWEWYTVYDFVEAVAQNSDAPQTDTFQYFCNIMLEREISGYRFINGVLTPIASEAELKEIEEAIDENSKAVSTHLGRALELFSDKESPDYRNSIKESISAVEAMCRQIAGDKNATLGAALKKLENDVPIHPALEGAFLKLYGYTSDEQGVRHALLDEASVAFEDAKFMLVACSAFVNYLRVKEEEARAAS